MLLVRSFRYRAINGTLHPSSTRSTTFPVKVQGIIKQAKSTPCVITNEITSITTQDNIDIVLTQHAETSLTLEGGANLLPFITTVVSGGELSISSANRCGILRDYNIPITAYISLPNLTHINYTGQGNITNTGVLNFPYLSVESSGGTGDIHLNVNADELSLRQHSGPADFTFTGNATKSYVYTLGNGWFYLNNLITDQSHVNQNGTGDIIVHAKNELIVEMRYSGNVLYSGDPILELADQSGSGDVIKE